MEFYEDDYDIEDGSYYYDDDPCTSSSETDSSSSNQEPSAIPEASIPDNSIAVCYSLDQSKGIIHDRLGISHTALRNFNVPGLVILSLKDINLIRKDSRNNRYLKHIIVIPVGEDFSFLHNDFAQSINVLTN